MSIMKLIRYSSHFSILLSYALLASATPITPTPIVLWHGMGDTYNGNSSMIKITSWIQDVFPNRFVYSIRVDEDPERDRKASYFGRVLDHLGTVCESLQSRPELADGFHAIGFSQGGLFLRGLVETCPLIQVKTLVTFGSPHAGVAEPPGCIPESDHTKQSGPIHVQSWNNNDDSVALVSMKSNCGVVRNLIQTGVYWSWIQKSVVQAQYFKKYQDITSYLEKCLFLPIINNEKSDKINEYRARLLSLEKLVLVRFDNDTMVVPRDTAWFSFYNDIGEIIPIQKQDIYRQDWIGLKSLDKQGKLIFESLPGEHLQLPEEIFKNDYILKYLK